MTKEMLIQNIQLNYPNTDMEQVYKLIELGENKGYSYDGIYILFKAYNDPNAFITIQEIQDAFNISDKRMLDAIENIEIKYGVDVIERHQKYTLIKEIDT